MKQRQVAALDPARSTSGKKSRPVQCATVQRRLVFLAAALALLAGGARAQNLEGADRIDAQASAALFESPIHESSTPVVDLRFARVHFLIEPEEHRIRGTLFAEAMLRDSTLRTLPVLIRGIDVESVQTAAPGDSLRPVSDLSSSGDTLYVPLLRPSVVDSLDAYTEPRTPGEPWGIAFGFSIRGGVRTVPIGDQAGAWTHAWTPFENGVPSWMPLPIGLDDQFGAELRISVPPDWNVFRTGRPTFDFIAEGVRTVASAFSDTATITNIGFVALADVDTLSDAPQFVAADRAPDALAAEEAVISIGRMVDFFNEMAGSEKPDSTRLVFLNGPARSSASGAGLTVLSSDVFPDGLDPVTEDFVLAEAVARSWVAESVRLAGWTDVWIREALPTYMALRYVLDRHGRAAYTEALWSCRDAYLAESKRYVRPLVWDRWLAPSDLLDAHARCKGAWVLHMLTERHEDGLVWFALQYLKELGAETSITSEEIREALERAAGEDLSDFFDEWVYAAGHPVLSNSYETAADQTSIRLHVLQEQDGNLVPSAFTLSLDVESASLSGIDRAQIDVSQPDVTISIPVQLRPQYVRLDPFGKVLFETSRPPDPSTLVSSLRRQDEPAARFIAARLLETVDVDPSLLIGIRPVLAQEDLSPIVERRLLSVLEMMAPSGTAIREILSIAADTTSRSRARAVWALGGFGGNPEARRIALAAANSSSDPLMLASAVEALVRLDSTLAWRVLQSAMVTESRGNIVRRTALKLIPSAPAEASEKLIVLLGALSQTGNPRLRLQAMKSLEAFADVPRARTALLESWAASTDSMRAVILADLEAGALRTRDREEIERWSAAEPLPALHRRLQLLLQADGN